MTCDVRQDRDWLNVYCDCCDLIVASAPTHGSAVQAADDHERMTATHRLDPR